jgi:hypothetical protein
MAVPGKGRFARVAVKAAEASVAGPTGKPETPKEAVHAAPALPPQVLKAMLPAPVAVCAAPMSAVSVPEAARDEQFAAELKLAVPVAEMASGLASEAACAIAAEKERRVSVTWHCRCPSGRRLLSRREWPFR